MKDPVKQVRDNQFALERLLKRTPEWPIENPFMSHALAFPLVERPPVLARAGHRPAR